MTRSYGGGPERQRNKEPELRESPEGGWERKLDMLSRYSPDEDTVIQPVRVDFGKRLVAGIIDLFGAYLVGLVVALIPIVNDFVTPQLSMTLVLLVRDWFFEGRALGKNLMGLQVVDIKTGAPCGLLQSIKRNVVLLAAPLALYFIMGIIRVVAAFHIPGMPTVSAALLQIINTIGFLYVVIVIPYEAVRAYNREDGRRFGDLFAGTALVEAPMDFSSLLPKR
jgi:uncharacterized RDD family membrane protein YckC